MYTYITNCSITLSVTLRKTLKLKLNTNNLIFSMVNGEKEMGVENK